MQNHFNLGVSAREGNPQPSFSVLRTNVWGTRSRGKLRATSMDESTQRLTDALTALAARDTTETNLCHAAERALPLVRDLLSAVLESKALAAAVASRSYVHSGGFTKLVLARSQGYQVRVHLWPTAAEDADPHDHRWSFASVPLLGSFAEDRYRQHNARDDYRIYACTPRSDCDYVTLRQVGRATLEQECHEQRFPGMPYACTAGDIHRITAHGRAASLVITAPPRRDYALVFRRDDPPLTLPAPPLAIAGVQDTARSVLLLFPR
jgi:hypothetical protein